MGFAVELYFDRTTEAAVRMLRQAVYASGITPFVDALGDRPHVSLAAFHDLDVAVTVPILQAFAAEVPPFRVSLSAVGFFPTAEGVVFLVPVPTQTLLAAHTRLYQSLEHAGMRTLPYYLPDNWVPHCTVEMQVGSDLLPGVVEACRKAWTPIAGEFVEVGLIEFRPVTPLHLFALRGP